MLVVLEFPFQFTHGHAHAVTAHSEPAQTALALRMKAQRSRAMSGRKRAASAVESGEMESDTRAIRKRAQNRLSQQCVREKRRAQSKHLDLLTSVIESSTGDQAECNESLVSAQLELVKENEELKDALLRLRKKLLSVSTAAAAAAGVCTFISHLLAYS